MDRSLPFSIHHYLCPPNLQFSSFLDQVSAQGFTSVALTQSALEAQPLDETIAALKKRRLHVSSLNSAGYFLEEATVRAQDKINARLIEQTAACGASCLNVIVGGTKELPLAEARELATNRLIKLYQQAKDAGVQLVVEPMTFLNVRTKSCFNTIAQMEKLADLIPDLHISVDLFHVWWDPDLERLLRGSSLPVGMLQICDVAIPHDETQPYRVPLGEGFIPWKEYVFAVKKAFPTVPIELELFANQLPGRKFEEIISNSSKSLAFFEESNNGSS